MNTKGQHIPALVTSGPDNTLTGAPTTGVLGQPGTVVLFGNETIDDQFRSGMRFTAGWWLNPIQTVGIEVSGFYLTPKGSVFSQASSGSPVLARPFLNPNINPDLTQAETALLVASATQSGSIRIVTHNDIWGAEVNARCNVAGCDWYRADLLVGGRYVQIKDNLNIANASTGLNGGFVPVPVPGGLVASSIFQDDSFLTRNDFYGAQLGTHVEIKRGNWFADFTAKLAAGVMHQSVDINGFTLANNTIGTGGTMGVTLFHAGLFAQPNQNIGHHSRTEFGLAPEVGVVAGYQFNDHIRAYVGYNILYFRTDVIRPGTQIDRIVVMPGTAAKPPSFNFRDQDFWAEGVVGGVEFSF
jgi:hypothetical protein